MTTGRINQVTTESDGRTADYARRSSRHTTPISQSETTERGTRCGSHVVRFTFFTSKNSTRRRPLSNDDDQSSYSTASTAAFSTVRLPNTPCEVGIFKTVEFISKLDRTESIVPNCFTETIARRRHPRREPLSRRSAMTPAGEHTTHAVRRKRSTPPS